MRQPWRDTPRAVSSPLPIPSSSSSDEADAGLMFAMSFSENGDDSALSPPIDHQLGHSLHPNALFHRARQQSARGSMGFARADTVLYNSIKKQPQTPQPLYSFPEPSACNNGDSSTSPDSPLSAGRWPNHSSFKRNPSSAHFRRYNPISQSSDDYHRGFTQQMTYDSTGGDDDEEDDAECSSDTNEPERSNPSMPPHLIRGNYPVHISSPQFDIQSTFKNDDHSTDPQKTVHPGRSQRKSVNVTPHHQGSSYVAVAHANNKFEAHIYSPPVQPRIDTKHSRHRSTHDVSLSTPRLDPVQFSQNQQHQQPSVGTSTRPRSNTGSGQYAPRHPLMSKVTATSYVSSSTLVPPGLGTAPKNESQNMVTSFRNFKI